MTLAFAVLQYSTIFSCSISEILILKCGVVVFSEPMKWFFLVFWIVLKIIRPPPTMKTKMINADTYTT